MVKTDRKFVDSLSEKEKAKILRDARKIKRIENPRRTVAPSAKQIAVRNRFSEKASQWKQLSASQKSGYGNKFSQYLKNTGL
jgi:hypothetical protein